MPILELGFVTVAAMWVMLFAHVADAQPVESFVKSSWAAYTLIEIGAPGAVLGVLGGVV